MKVKELMTPNVVAVAPDDTLKDVAAVLVEHGISGVPVIDRDGAVVGVVSEADILMKERAAEPEPRILRWLLDGPVTGMQKLDARTAAEAMSAPATTIGPDKGVYEAARVMTDDGIKRLPVVDREGTLVGIVTRSDLVRAFARPDDSLLREIHEMAHDTLGIADESFWIRVDEGAVRLSGKLERRSDAELLPRVVSRTPGVVSVHSTLRWDWDDRKASIESDPRVPVAPRR
jgi:CBS domain-containing protein